MSRFNRKKRGWKSLKIKSNGGITDLIDNAIKEAWYITDKEYDTICDKLTDDELNLFLSEYPTFSEKKILLNLVDKYIDIQSYRDDQLDRLL